MNVDRAVLTFAGAMVLVSVALAYFLSPWFLLLTAWVGVMLFQSGITGFCPMAFVFKILGIKPGSAFR
jgi:positive regulator of sigma E activity